MQLCGNYTEDSLQRIAKYVFSEEATVQERMGHRTGDWTDQVQKGVEDLSAADVFSFHADREMPGAPGYKRKDSVDFQGLRRHIKRYNKELSFYVKDTFQDI